MPSKRLYRLTLDPTTGDLTCRLGRVSFTLHRNKKGHVDILRDGKRINTESGIRPACDYISTLRITP